jgi:hypothetical protein
MFNHEVLYLLILINYSLWDPFFNDNHVASALGVNLVSHVFPGLRSTL